MSDSGWKFQAGDRIEEPAEFRMSIGEEEIDTSGYTVLRRILGISDGTRMYYVENEFGDTHLYTARAIEGTYRSVDTDK